MARRPQHSIHPAMSLKVSPNGSPAAPVSKSTSQQPTIAYPAKSISKLPSGVQFPLLVLLNLTFSYFLYLLGATFTNYELSTVSKRTPSDGDAWRVAAVLGWRITEIAVGWFGGFDDYDIASLTILSRLPFYYLLNSFYGITLRTTILCLCLDILGATLPVMLLRGRAAHHIPSAAVPNRAIVHDPAVALLTTLVPSAIYSVLVYASFATWLPVHMVKHFDGVHSLAAAHDAQVVTLLVSFFPLGWAARAFLFAPATTAQGERRKKSFNPVTASLGETVRYNLWAWRGGWKVLVRRVATLASMVGVATWIKVWGSLEGSEAYGAFGWAALWAGASVVVGLVLGWVGEL